MRVIHAGAAPCSCPLLPRRHREQLLSVRDTQVGVVQTSQHPGQLPRPLGLLSLVLLPAAATLIVTGAFVTAAGPHPGASGKDIPRLGNVVDAAHVHAVANAVFGSILAACVIVLYFPCRWFARVRSQRSSRWLSYL